MFCLLIKHLIYQLHTRYTMKKLLILPLFSLLLAGCGNSIPSECVTTIKEFDDFIAEMEKQPNIPDATKAQLKSSRDSLEQSLKGMKGDQAIQTCKAASYSFTQLKNMLPK